MVRTLFLVDLLNIDKVNYWYIKKYELVTIIYFIHTTDNCDTKPPARDTTTQVPETTTTQVASSSCKYFHFTENITLEQYSFYYRILSEIDLNEKKYTSSS